MSFWMSCKVIILENFAKEIKRLHKKYKNIKSDIRQLSKQLQANPKSGILLGNNCYKIRVSNSSIPTGKSGGFRVIYYYLYDDDNIFLITIYSKRDLENISDKVVLELLKKYGLD